MLVIVEQHQHLGRPIRWKWRVPDHPAVLETLRDDVDAGLAPTRAAEEVEGFILGAEDLAEAADRELTTRNLAALRIEAIATPHQQSARCEPPVRAAVEKGRDA